MRIISSDALRGRIQAESSFSLTKPAMKIDLIVQEMENHDTEVTIAGLTIKKGLFSKRVDKETSEAEILENLSTIL